MPGFLVAALVVDSARGLCKAGIAGISPRAVFHSVVFMPAMLGIMACMTQVDSRIEEYKNGLFWETTPLFPFSALWFNSGYICQSTEAWFVLKTAENCGVSAVAVHRWSSIISCRGAEAGSHGPVQITIEILLQYIDKVIDVCCAGPANSCAVVGDS